MTNYVSMLNQQKYAQTHTPQMSIPEGMESQMIQGGSGGYAFKANSFDQLQRALILGTISNGYYADAKTKTCDFLDCLSVCAKQDIKKTMEIIRYARNGKALNPSSTILAINHLSKCQEQEIKNAFKELFPEIIRTGSQFYEWLAYAKSTRGMGKVVREVGRSWLLSKQPKDLSYQFLKYQSRNGFSHRDALRLFHPKTDNPELNSLFKWATKGWETLPPDGSLIPESLKQIYWFEWLKKNPNEAVTAIHEGKLTHEMCTGVGKMDKKAWTVLLPNMPVTALLRHLGALTANNTLSSTETELIDHVKKILLNKEILTKAKIHPLDVAKALFTYSSGGAAGRSQNHYSPVPRIVDILNECLELSFNCLEPTGLTFAHFIDVSGSMNTPSGSFGMSCQNVAALMAYACIKSEENYDIFSFDTMCRQVLISKSDSFRSAKEKIQRSGGGGTDCSLMFYTLNKQKKKFDVVVGYTDNESWAGNQHTFQALDDYRKRVNPNCKVIMCTLAANNLVLTRPGDKLSLDIAGCDPNTPKLIQMFAKGEF